MIDTGVKRHSTALDKTTEVVARVCEGRKQAAATMLIERGSSLSPAGTDRLKKIAASST